MRTRKLAATALMTFLIALPLACGGGGGGGSDGGPEGVTGDLVLLDMNVDRTEGVPLNRILEFDFSEPLDADSVRPDTIRIRRGPNFAAQVPGRFETDGNRVRFYPRLPVNADLSDAGLRPGTTYRVTLPGLPATATVRSAAGDPLVAEATATFITATPADGLFLDNFGDGGDPRVVSVSPADGATDVATASDLVLTFNRRPLDPASVTVSNIHLTLVSRDGRALERPVAGRPMLEQSHESVKVRFVPDFPLADRAVYRIEVERRARDLVGNDVAPFSSVFTTADEPARPGEIVVEFDAAERDTLMDVTETTASWSDETPDALAALFTVAGGDGTAGDFAPDADTTVTPDDFPRGATVQVRDGVEADVINFRSIEIPEGVRVRFAPRPAGPNRPLVLLSLRNVTIRGDLDVSGGTGANAEQNLRSSRIPLAMGGNAGPGATAGADNYTGSQHRNAPEMDAADISDGPTGGEGGSVSGHSRYSWAGGGGGGASRTDGEDGTKGGYSFSSAYNGDGGAGGESPESLGLPLNSERTPNLGGTGGGAGGLGYYWPTSTNWRQGGGGGGGGGGAVTIQTAGDILLASGSRLNAAGGDGGATSPTTSYYGGAGGGGAGGSVLLRGTGRVELEAGATIDVSGGTGGAYLSTFTRYRGGEGGDGGDGYVRIEASENENSPGDPLVDGLAQSSITEGAGTTGLFSPRGGGAPSVGRTVFLNLGVFDPVMIRPGARDVVSSLFNDEMRIEVQMAVEDLGNLGRPDLSALDVTDVDGDGERDDSLDPARLSEWTRLAEIETLNGRGYSFLRIRVVFQLDSNQGPEDPLPFLEKLRIPYEF